jgi:hypothetical protein
MAGPSNKRELNLGSFPHTVINFLCMVKECVELYCNELQEEKVGEDMLRVEDWVYEQNYRLIESLIRGLI